MEQYYIDEKGNDTIVGRLIAESERLFNSNPRKSDSLILEAYNNFFYDSNISDSTRADVMHYIGKHLVDNGEYQSGIDSLQKSYSIRLNATPEDTNLLCKTLVYIGNGYFQLGVYDSAFVYYKDVRNKLLASNTYDINLFHSMLNIGIIYASMNVFDTALCYFDTARVVLDTAGLADSIDFAATYYYNYALLNTYSGKLKEADTFYKISSELYTEKDGEINKSIAGILNNLGLNHYFAYELSEAELLFKRSLEVYKLLDDEVPEKIAHIYYNLSTIAKRKTEYHNAIQYCRDGLEVEPSDDLKTRLFINMASTYDKLNNPEMANRYFLNALGLMGSENVNPKRKQEIIIEYAKFLKKSSNPTISYKYFKKALEESKKLNGVKSRNYGEHLLELGYYFIDIDQNPDSALKYFENSRFIFDNLSSGNDIDNLNQINQKRAETGIAKSYKLKFDQTNRLNYLYLADSVFADVLYQQDSIIKNLSTANKLVVISSMNDIYKDAVNCSYELFQLTDDDKRLNRIFNYIERSKSSALLGEVNSENALKTSDIPVEIFEFENNIKDRINNLMQMTENEKSSSDPDLAKLRFFESNLLSLLVEYDSLIDCIEERFPKYYSVKYHSDIINIDELQKNLDADQALLEYMLSDTVLYIVGITQDNYALEKVSINDDFYSRLNNIISVKNINLNDQNKELFYQFKSDSYELWRVLIEPHIELIENKRLIIIPDGMLGYLPFDILIEYDFETDKINYRDLPYMIRNHPISYSYSATLRYNTYFDKPENINHTNIIAFSPTYENNTDTNVNLYELKQAKSEVKSIVSNFGGKAYTDDRATKSEFEEHANKARVLHLAMHAIINDSLPLQSKLVFYDDPEDTISNYMFTHEIFNKDINASLVTLSACNTGSGEFKKGEGIMSLSRGFVYAGVPSIIMTLWEVQDVTGSKIMNRFYENMFDGMTKDIALQEAKLSVLKEANMANSHPFFWSAYVINGDVSEIENLPDKQGGKYRFIILAIIAFISIMIYRYLKARKKRREP